MNNATKITLASAILAALASGVAQSAIDTRVFQPGRSLEILRGPLPPLFFQPVRNATCPNGADPTFRSGILSCAIDVNQFANVVCPNPQFPRYVAIVSGANPSERDICAAATADGQAIASSTNLALTETKHSCDAGDALLRHTSGVLCLNAGISFGANASLTGFRKAPAANHNNGDYYDASATQEVKFNLNVDYERIPTDGSKNGRSYVAGIPIADVDGQNWRLDVSVAGATDKFKRVVKRPVSAVLINP